MAKDRQGYLFKKPNGKLYARLTFITATGKRRNIVRLVENRKEGRALLRQLSLEVDDYLANHQSRIDAAKISIDWLCDHYLEHYCKAAAYVKDRKVDGLRNWRRVRTYIENIRTEFGNRLLRSLTYGDLLRYRQTRLSAPTKRLSTEGQRSITAVNRELEYFRRILNIAEREGWIERTPFAPGLISKADETKRERIITREEEDRLLLSCDKGKRRHIRALVICALDTGMRRGEILSLRWSDIDLASRIITIRAFNTKTMRSRQVGITNRLAGEFERLCEAQEAQRAARQDDNCLIFNVTQFDKAFRNATKDAGLIGVRFHDLRHTAATRLIEGGLSIQLVGKVLGHTQANTTYRYINANLQTAQAAAAIFDRMAEPGSAARGQATSESENEAKREFIN